MRIRRAAGSLVLVLTLGGCASGDSPGPGPLPGITAPAPSPAPVRVPADGLLLRSFGYSFGPLDSFSLPRTTQLVTAVDQADNVTAVLAAPPAADVADYLRRALPAAGYTVTGDAGDATLTFAGHGWTGRFTGGQRSSAVLLRPA